MITKPYAGGSQQSLGAASSRDADDATAELSVECTSLFVYDNVEQQQQHSGFDVSYHDCVSENSATPSELLYQHSSHLQHVPQQQQQQQQHGCDADEDAVVKLQLLAGCGSNAPLDYPWMRDKKSASDAVCLSTSMSDRQLKQCLTSDPLVQTPGLSVLD